MNKAAEVSTTKKERDRAIEKAQGLFIVTMLDLSWRLAVVFLLPTLLGVFIDNQLDSGSVATIIGMIIGTIGAVMVIRNIIKKLPTGDNKK